MSSERGPQSAEYGVRPADVCGARRECGVRSCAAGRCKQSQPVSAEPADVCGVRSADRVGTADCRRRGRPMSAERGTRSTAECAVLF